MATKFGLGLASAVLGVSVGALAVIASVSAIEAAMPPSVPDRISRSLAVDHLAARFTAGRHVATVRGLAPKRVMAPLRRTTTAPSAFGAACVGGDLIGIGEELGAVPVGVDINGRTLWAAVSTKQAGQFSRAKPRSP